MATDPRKLRPSELCRLLNSTPLGEVINERQLYRHRQRAGNRIGDNKTVDLLRYCAWMHQVRHAPRPTSDADPYERMKESARARNAALALAGRDIGEIPVVENPDRKDRASRDFQFFCESYFPLTFHLAWSPDHVKVIQKIEQAVVHGGLFALAMARGSGKSSIAEVACIWAVLYGHREFICLIGSDEGHACDMLESIKTELDSNDSLLADFPEVCFAIQALDGISNRANGQLYKGKRTQIGWTAKEVVLPTIEGSRASGAIIKVAGLTGRIRGMKFKRPDGRTVRPSLVVLDDPQTDESARSLSQCVNRESILAGAVLGLAGPGKKISGIMPCTVIRPGDMADNILDRDKHPEWNGERTRMVYAFPTNETLWLRYAEIRAEGMRNGDGGASATEFYRANKDAMDAGSRIAWPERFNHDELSAIQHAMNLKLQDEAAFFAEYQNEPLPAETIVDGMLTADEVARKFNRLERSCISVGANHLTAFIDIQQKLLYYLVAAWEDDFTGYVVDYGCYPDQHRNYFTLRDARHTLVTEAEGTGLEGSIYAGLDSLTTKLLDREWQRDDGAAMKIGRCLIDANWGHSTDVVYQFCRQSKHAAVVMPTHGRFVGASSMPFSEYKRRPGDRVGLNWRIPNVHGKRAIRHVVFDTNWWKSFVHARLAVSMGDRGCLSVFGDNQESHRMLAEHLTAEYFIKTEGRGRSVDEWKQRPEQPDNHWLDCLVGTAVAASMQGSVLFGTDSVREHNSTRVSFKDMQKRRRS
ncbi:MAG: phage terminase large subunit family protein [Planctomycetota bacterium]|nr:phage terminase large subunit family protein [Planctomycetota bacterium]